MTHELTQKGHDLPMELERKEPEETEMALNALSLFLDIFSMRNKATFGAADLKALGSKQHALLTKPGGDWDQWIVSGYLLLKESPEIVLDYGINHGYLQTTQ